RMRPPVRAHRVGSSQPRRANRGSRQSRSTNTHPRLGHGTGWRMDGTGTPSGMYRPAVPPNLGRIVALPLTGVLLVVFAWELAYLFPYIASQDAVGTDHTFYREVGQRWLDTGVYYLPHQLAGPYQVQADVDVL